jgi:hypothetical protein
VGAAVGAARALATRTEGKTDADEHDDGVHDDEATDEDDTLEPELQSHRDSDRDGTGDTEPEPQEEEPQERRRRQPPRRQPEPRQGVSSDTVRSIADRAREQLRELHGKDPESVTSLERIGDGWRVTFEVLEVERIPSSTDVLGTYVVEVDDDAQLLSFERVRRYSRAQSDRGGDR